jgi:hypothetical protein
MSTKNNKKEHSPYIPMFWGMGLAVMLLFAGVGVASAADYYVALDGDNTNPGNETHPWKTVQKAADTLVAGDTVYIKAGTYNERVMPRNNGASGNYITYTAYPGDTVTIDGTGLPTYPSGLFRIENKDYIKVSGLRLKNYTNTGACFGIYIYNGCDHIIIENNIINNMDGCGIYAHVNANNIIIDNNEVSYTNLDPAWGQEMISLCDVHTFEIKYNQVSNSDNIGIDAKCGSSNGKIYNNYVHDVSSGIYLDAGSGYEHDIDVYTNRVHDVTANCYQAATENGGTLENIRFFNNIGYNPGSRGFVIYNYDGPKKNIAVINNAFYNSGTYSMMCVSTNAENVIFRNNICSQSSGIKTNDLPEVIVDHNLIDGWSPTYGDNCVRADPKFVNPSAGDFHLQSDSPAIDSGSSVGAPSFDFDGNPRPQGAGYDIGAYEYGGVASALGGEWHFDEGTGGIVAADSSGNGNDGTLTNMDPAIDWVDGKLGKALDFDGADDYVDLPLMKDTSAYTMEMWVYPDALGGFIFANDAANGNWKSSASTSTWYTRIDGSSTRDDMALSSLTTGEWTYLAFTYDGVNDVKKVYKNGVIVTTKTPTSHGAGSLDLDSATANMIGNSNDGSNFNGTIDEVRIYNRVLSADEIKADYQEGTPVAEWHFDEGSGIVAADSSGNVNSGTINGATWTTGKIGSALNFDGVNDYVDCGRGASLNITDAITISAWVKLAADNPTWTRIIQKGSANNHYGYVVGIHTNKVEFQRDFNNADFTKSKSYSVVPNVWYHLAGVYNGRTAVLYVNGIEATDAWKGTQFNSESDILYIGRRSRDCANYFNGIIDEVKIYSRALSAAEIKADYEAGVDNTYSRYDVNEDGKVDILDTTIVGQHFAETTNSSYPRYDVNEDGKVDILDTTIVEQHFGEITS